MHVFERVPSVAGSTSKSGAKMTVKSDRNLWPGTFRCLSRQLPREEGVPGALRDHADPQRIGRVRAAEAILHEQLFAFQKLQQARLDAVENRRAHRLVHRSPVHGRFGVAIADNVLVLRRAARELAGSNHQGAAFRQHSFAVLNRFFDQFGGGKIPMHHGGVGYTLIAQILGMSAIDFADSYL